MLLCLIIVRICVAVNIKCGCRILNIIFIPAARAESSINAQTYYLVVSRDKYEV